MAAGYTTTNTHIVILPTPGIGHLIPLVQFANILLHHHHISSTFLIPPNGGAPPPPAQKSLLSGVDHLLLPTVDFSDLPPDTKVETRICLTAARSLPAIRAAVQNLLDGGKRIAAFVADLFGTDGFDAAADFGIPPYVFYPSTAMALSLFFYLPELDETVSCEFRDVPGKIKIPGCLPVSGKDLFDPAQDRTNDAYKLVLRQASRYRMAEGIIVNSFEELEPGPIRYLVKKDNGIEPIVYPIGPLVQTGLKSKVNEENSLCLEWLDDQPRSSVLYVSFGSGGTLSHDQIIELALGLEMSEQRFLWVLRCPNNTSPGATYFGIENPEDPLAYLPRGFLDRTRGQGVVVPKWAPQAEILAHESVGGFLTHCGWNSTLESVVHGVPLIAWPLYAEQKMNAVMLHEDVKVALRPRVDENGLVGSAEIANVVKGLMEGEEGKGIRSRMRDLKNDAAKVLGEDGSSTKTLAELASKWKNSVV